MQPAMRLLVAAVSFGCLAQLGDAKCKDNSACSGIKSLSFLGIVCTSNVHKAAESLKVKDKVPKSIKPYHQIQHFCPVYCKFCKTPVKASLTLSQDFAAIADVAKFKIEYQAELASLLQLAAENALTIDNIKAGSTIVDITIAYNESNTKTPSASMDKLNDKIAKSATCVEPCCSGMTSVVAGVTTCNTATCSAEAKRSQCMSSGKWGKMTTGVKIVLEPEAEPGMSLVTFIVLILLGVIFFFICLCCMCCWCCHCCMPCFKKKDGNKISVNAAEP